MKDSQANSLALCPFCGGEAYIYAPGPAEHHVACKNPNCYAETHGWITEAEAIAAWNSRAERTCKPIIEPWESDKTKYDAYCGNCNYPLGDGKLMPWNYCPNCGCKVIGG